MDSPEVRAKLAQATADEQAAQAVAQKAQNGARPQEIEMARMQWQRAETAAQLAQTSFRRVDGLGARRPGGRPEARRGRGQLEGLRDAADRRQGAVRHGTRRRTPRGPAAASAQARQVAGVVAEAEAAGSETELRSPVAGEVAKVLAKVGELSPQGVAVVTVVDLADQWVVLQRREDRLLALRDGQRVRALRLPALPRTILRGALQGRLQRRAARLRDRRATRGGAGFDVRTFEVGARPLQPIEGARPRHERAGWTQNMSLRGFSTGQRIGASSPLLRTRPWDPAMITWVPLLAVLFDLGGSSPAGLPERLPIGVLDQGPARALSRQLVRFLDATPGLVRGAALRRRRRDGARAHQRRGRRRAVQLRRAISTASIKPGPHGPGPCCRTTPSSARIRA